MKRITPRAPRMPRETRRRINRRAAELARGAYGRYRAELQAAIAENVELIDRIWSWRLSDQRG